MRMSRAQFKYALRKCRLEERSITSTKLAPLSNCVAGVTGETAIANMWRDHYEEFLNSSTNSCEKKDGALGNTIIHFKTIRNTRTLSYSHF